MEQLITIAFDGTGNEPSDGINGTLFETYTYDNSISNVLKLHLMLGGNLHHDERYSANDQSNIAHSFYYQGVGTYGSWFNKAINQGLAPNEQDVASILRQAKADLKKVYQATQPILIIGFSRGAALARRFATIINDFVSEQSVHLLVFDTVASIGLPNLSTDERPKFDVVFEHGHSLANTVRNALHLVSLDEKRKAFQPTLMNHDPKRVHEIWFAGAHSDVGGGYFYDGLADITLKFAIDWLTFMQRKGLPAFKITDPPPTLENQLPSDLQTAITRDSLVLAPDPTGHSHEQTRSDLISKLTLDDRRCVVIDNNQVNSELTPIIHHSVIERIIRVEQYQPSSLQNVTHLILKRLTEQLSEANCATSHKQKNAASLLKTLGFNEQVSVTVFANLPDNYTGILAEQGDRFLIKANLNHVWFNNQIATNATGWSRDDVSLGIKEIAIKANEDERRIPAVNWLALCAAISGDKNTHFIGEEAIFCAPIRGEITLFGNHVEHEYQNNAGAIEVTITKI